jgi:hypothetical protein
MTTTLNNFVSETQLTTSEVSLVTTGSGEKKFIGMATVTNTAATNQLVTVWRLSTATAGTDGVGGNYIWRKSIGANSTERLDKIMGQVLGASMKLSAKGETGAVINVDISGTTET